MPTIVSYVWGDRFFAFPCQLRHAGGRTFRFVIKLLLMDEDPHGDEEKKPKRKFDEVTQGEMCCGGQSEKKRKAAAKTAEESDESSNTVLPTSDQSTSSAPVSLVADAPPVDNGPAEGAEAPQGKSVAPGVLIHRPGALPVSVAPLKQAEVKLQVYPAYRQLGNQRIETSIMVSKVHVGSVIGKGGKNIQAIRMQSGANVRIQNDVDSPPEATDRVVSIVGHPQQVQAGKWVCRWQGVCLRHPHWR